MCTGHSVAPPYVDAASFWHGFCFCGMACENVELGTRGAWRPALELGEYDRALVVRAEPSAANAAIVPVDGQRSPHPLSGALAARRTSGSRRTRTSIAIPFARTWSALRFAAGMAILSVVFVVSHSLVLVHELTQGTPATDGS